MISIITAIFNQLDMNKLYYESLLATTDGDWELIIIDNGSTDGSVEYFESLGSRVKVIRNDGNYSYPYCQNIGIKAATGEVLAFFNNDIILSPHWDSRMLRVLGKDGYHVVSLASNDRMGDYASTKRLSRRWKHIKYPIITLFGQRSRALRAMIRLTYGNWERYCERVWQKWGEKMLIGFSGSVVIMTRQAIELIGEWDPSQQGADFDIFLRTMVRYESHGDIKPLSIISGVTHHHFRRLTLRCSYPPFKDLANLTSLQEKWGQDTLDRYIPLIKWRTSQSEE